MNSTVIDLKITTFDGNEKVLNQEGFVSLDIDDLIKWLYDNYNRLKELEADDYLGN